MTPPTDTPLKVEETVRALHDAAKTCDSRATFYVAHREEYQQDATNLRQLASALPALIADRERMDWIEQNPNSAPRWIRTNPTMEPQPLWLAYSPVEGSTRRFTFREAIDAARAVSSSPQQPTPAPSSLPAATAPEATAGQLAAQGRCIKCGNPLPAGEVGCFTICEACWKVVHPDSPLREGATELDMDEVRHVAAGKDEWFTTKLAREILRLRARLSPSEAPGAIGTPWPARDVVHVLSDAVAHLFNAHDCDHHGYERIVSAKDVADQWLARPPSSQGSPPAAGKTREIPESDHG